MAELVTAEMGSPALFSVFAQAAILSLYDPDRSRTITNVGEIRPWPAFLGVMRAALTAQQALKGCSEREAKHDVARDRAVAARRLDRLPKRVERAGADIAKDDAERGDRQRQGPAWVCGLGGRGRGH